MRMLPGDDEFMGCTAGYTRIVMVMKMQQPGRTALIIPVPGNDTMGALWAQQLYFLPCCRQFPGHMHVHLFHVGIYKPAVLE